MTVLDVIQKSTEFLARKEVDSPRLQVELLLAHVLKMPRMKLYLNFDRVLAEEELAALRDLVKRRGTHEPLQHILGSTSFCGFEIAVNRDVLIPRPETELLAERGWLYLNALVQQGISQPIAFDFGAGSGCLPIALAGNCPSATIHSVEISAAALTVARENAERNKVADRIQFYLGDGFSVLPKDLRFDLIIGNPPYIPTGEIPTLQPEVRDFDPTGALDGGNDGLDFYRRIAVEAIPFSKPKARLMLEFGDGQAPAIRNIFEAKNWAIESVARDLTQRERFLIAVAPER